MVDEKDIRFRIAAARRMLHREGCDSNIGGHVSARREDVDGAFWVTGFEYFDTTTPDRVALLDFDLNPVEGALAMSPAVNFHARIYRERPDVNAIIHLHSHWISVLSSIPGQTVGMYNVSAVLFHDEQATYFDDGVRSHLDVVDALGDKRVVLMKNHGAIIASDSLEHATIEAMTLEACARYHLECVAAGGTEILEAEVLSGKAMYRRHYLPQMWAANLERLRTSDPDLFSA
jgi:L-fuculose-phosphate aldolase